MGDIVFESDERDIEETTLGFLAFEHGLGKAFLCFL
jgi:hypothetical protein